MKRLFIVFLALSFIIVCLTQAMGQTAEPVKKTITLPRENVELKQGDGLDRVLVNCLVCHSGDYITMQPKFSKAQWIAETTKMMKVFGAKISEDDAKIISEYLGEQYGTGR